jgi:hypothetical protein
MFDLSALVILTLFNLIAVLQVATMTTTTNRLQDTLRQGAAVLCLSVSLAGLGLAMLVPTPGMGIATVCIAALVNLIALLGPGLRQLSDPRVAETASHLRGLARLYIVGSPYEPAAVSASGGPAPIAPSSAQPRKKTTSRPLTAGEIRSIRPVRPSAMRGGSGPLPRITGQPTSGAIAAQRSLALAASRKARQTSQPDHLSRRATYDVPRRPNRLPPTSLAFLLSVDNEPDIFADARESMSLLPALARRVRLVSTDPNRPAITSHAPTVLPNILAAPDPAWTTSYGRLAALYRSA